MSYKSLGEFAKYVAFKDSAAGIFSSYRAELDVKNDIIRTKSLVNKEYKLIIGRWKNISAKSDSIILKKDNLLEIYAIKLKKQKRKKWIWFITGGAIVAILSSFSGS